MGDPGEGGGSWTVESTPINIREYLKNGLQHGFEIFFTFNIYYLGPFSQNFRSASLFLRKLEPFFQGWLEKFCLVTKIQHFLPYLKTKVKS